MLAGTTEARQLAEAIATTRSSPPIVVTVSFAGRTSKTTPMAGEIRVGGFGGIDGLVAFLRDQRIDAVLDATHPFAAIMPFHAAAACESTNTPLLRLLRPAWDMTQRDRWVRVASLQLAARALRTLGSKHVLLASGRQELAPFAALDDVEFTVRSIEPPDVSGFTHAEVVLERGPFTVESEITLLQRRSIDTIVTKDSGGSATIEKLEAARRLGITVVIVDRPPSPDVATVSTVDEALTWVLEHAGPFEHGVAMPDAPG